MDDVVRFWSVTGLLCTAPPNLVSIDKPLVSVNERENPFRLGLGMNGSLFGFGFWLLDCELSKVEGVPNKKRKKQRNKKPKNNRIKTMNERGKQ